MDWIFSALLLILAVWIAIGGSLLAVRFREYKRLRENIFLSNNQQHLLVLWAVAIPTIILVIVTYNYAVATASMAADYKIQTTKIVEDFELNNRPWIEIDGEFIIELVNGEIITLPAAPSIGEAEKVENFFDKIKQPNNISLITLILYVKNTGKKPAKSKEGSFVHIFIDGNHFDDSSFPEKYFTNRQLAFKTIGITTNKFLFPNSFKLEYNVNFEYSDLSETTSVDNYKYLTDVMISLEMNEKGVFRDLRYNKLK